jgi:hypothetical protein
MDDLGKVGIWLNCGIEVYVLRRMGSATQRIVAKAPFLPTYLRAVPSVDVGGFPMVAVP